MQSQDGLTAAGQNMLDIAIVGGGLAGLSCAVRAMELGAQVCVFEQGDSERYPCNSRYSGGMFHLDYLDIGLPEALLASTLLERCPADVDRELVELIARHARRAVGWLQKAGGARFIRVGPQSYEKWVLAPPRPPKPGLVHPGRGPDVVLNTLAARLRNAGQTIQRGITVVDVATAPDGYSVSVLHRGSIARVRARAVVFADGGFQGNQAMVSRHIAPFASRVLQRNAGTAQGSGVSIASALGARLSPLGSFYGHLVAQKALHDEGLWPYPMIDGLAKAGVLIGPDGRRFTDEGRTGVYLANAVAKRADPASAIVVFDDRTWWSTGRSTRVPPNPVLTHRGGCLWSASSIDELATRAGVDHTTLNATIAAHNGFIQSHGSEPMEPPRSWRIGSAHPVATPPFHAIPVCAGITYTMGGIAITTRGEVRSNGGAPLPGLYAAGATVGGIEGGEFSFYMGGLCKALVLGLVSAENAIVYLRNAHPGSDHRHKEHT